MNKLKIGIGILILMGIVVGYTVYSDYVLNRNSKSGPIIENRIEAPDFEDVFTPAKGK